jgi:DNA-binding transcriptional LysR family regulator
VRLLHRGRRVELTEAGRALLDKARQAIEAADAAARAAQQAGAAVRGRLRVGYPATGIFELPPLALRSFAERFPDVGVETVVASTGAHLEALEAKRLDVAFVRLGVLDRETMSFRSLQAEPLVLAAPADHPLARLPVVPVERLAGEPIILVPHAVEPLLYRYLVSDVLGRSRVVPSVVLEATTLESACSAVAARLGVAFVAEALTQVLSVPGVVYRPFAPPGWPGARTRPARPCDGSLSCSTSSPPGPASGWPRWPAAGWRHERARRDRAGRRGRDQGRQQP